jgi:hypothetical protein
MMKIYIPVQVSVVVEKLITGRSVSQLHLEESGVQYQSFDYCVRECSRQERNHSTVVLALTVANRSLTMVPHPSVVVIIEMT